MKTSISNDRVCVKLGSVNNKEFINRESYKLLIQFFELPPATTTIFDGVVLYEVPYHQVISGRENAKYFLEIDYEGVTTTPYSISSLNEEHASKVNNKPDFWFSEYTYCQQQMNPEPFKVDTGSFPEKISVVTVTRLFEMVADGQNVKIVTQELLTNPMKDITSDEKIIFEFDPLYKVEIYLEPTTTDIEGILKLIIPNVFFENR